VTIAFSSGDVGPTFLHFVAHIIGVCARKQMVWIYTARVIASVERLHVQKQITSMQRI
jgi:hypothetical protein